MKSMDAQSALTFASHKWKMCKSTPTLSLWYYSKGDTAPFFIFALEVVCFFSLQTKCFFSLSNFCNNLYSGYSSKKNHFKFLEISGIFCFLCTWEVHVDIWPMGLVCWKEFVFGFLKKFYLVIMKVHCKHVFFLETSF